LRWDQIEQCLASVVHQNHFASGAFVTQSQTGEIGMQERLELIAAMASSYLRRNAIGIDQIEHVVRSIGRALANAEAEVERKPSPALEYAASKPSIAQRGRAPAVSKDRSIECDALICLEDGERVKMLKRHLRTAHGMTPDEYREKWGLPSEYPMMPPASRERRSKMARERGLGRKRGPRRQKLGGRGRRTKVASKRGLAMAGSKTKRRQRKQA
jgi:predicted transcriptional regulator